MDTILAALLASLPVIIGGGLAVLALYLLSKWNNAEDPNVALRRKYIGFAIQAVRWAEKAIPDTTQNKYLAKADMAMKSFEKLVDEHGDPEDFKGGLQGWFIGVKEEVLLELAKAKVASVTPPADTAPPK